jgi:hypothetical protein
VAAAVTGADGAPGGGARSGRVPDGSGSPDRRGRADGWVDRDYGLYRRRSSPSPNRYHGYYGIQAIVRDVGPGGGWPTLTKTSYVEWAAVMRVRLQVRHMRKVVQYGDVDTTRIDGRWMPSLLQSCPRCSSRFLKSGLPRRLGTPSLRHASAVTAPGRPCYRHFLAQLDQLTQRIALEQRPKALIYRFDELGPRRLAVVAFA